MPTEDELRGQFHDDTAAGSTRSIDLDEVLRRSRARRRPRTVAVAVVSSLAVLAIVVPVSVGVALGQTGQLSASSSSATSTNQDSSRSAAGRPAPGAAPVGPSVGPSTGSSVGGSAPAQKVNICATALTQLAPAPNGLVLSVHPITAAATGRNIPATVTLTNTSTTAFTGSASPFPIMTLSRGGIVLWHSNGAVPSLAQVIELPAGASTSFSTTFEPLVCGVADEHGGSFRADLPAAGPGDYQLSAVMAVSSDTGAAVLVSGPPATVNLH
ncbi:MAG: hypothetical protein HIU88_04335 [Acidobacteria bacterium]|nr:hypothetical protein [Acidobacteriota bacterium]